GRRAPVCSVSRVMNVPLDTSARMRATICASQGRMHPILSAVVREKPKVSTKLLPLVAGLFLLALFSNTSALAARMMTEHACAADEEYRCYSVAVPQGGGKGDLSIEAPVSPRTNAAAHGSAIFAEDRRACVARGAEASAAAVRSRPETSSMAAT